MKISALIVCSFVVGLLSCVSAHAQSVPSGIWLTEKGQARIQVSSCGVAICGKVVWLREPIDPATGQPRTDIRNPNPTFARRPMIGVQLFLNMRPSGQGTWAGRIYNADDGGVYAGRVIWQGADQLRIEGCLGAICGGETWTRVGRR